MKPGDALLLALTVLSLVNLAGLVIVATIQLRLLNTLLDDAKAEAKGANRGE